MTMIERLLSIRRKTPRITSNTTSVSASSANTSASASASSTNGSSRIRYTNLLLLFLPGQVGLYERTSSSPYRVVVSTKTIFPRIGIMIIITAILCFVHLLTVPLSLIMSNLTTSGSRRQVVVTTTTTFAKRPLSSLVLIPIQPYHNCWGGFVKTVCHVTYIIEGLDIIPIGQDTSDESLNVICNYLWNTGATSDVAYSPVCIQNSKTVAMIATYDDFMTKHQRRQRKRPPHTTGVSQGTGTEVVNQSHRLMYELQIIEHYDDPIILDFLEHGLPHGTVVRRVPLKYIDFPFFYSGVYDTNNWIWEKGRDTNFGNMVWRYASSRMLNPATTLVDIRDDWLNISSSSSSFKQQQQQHQQGYSKKVSALVLAMSTLQVTNETQYDTFISNITQLVRDRNVPTIVMGIGMRLDMGDINNNGTIKRNDLTIQHSYQKQLLHEISIHQHVPAIGVRGELTKAICTNSGFTNCVSLGCPSLTISRDNNLGTIILDNWSKIIRKLASAAVQEVRIAVSFPSFIGTDPSNTAIRFLCTVLENFGKQATVIIQTTNDKIQLENYIKSNWHTINPTSTLQTTDIQYDEYYNVESWLASSKQRYHLCISSRIQGSMVFISNGIPAVVIPTDLRTMELVHSMQVPYILPDQLDEILSTPYVAVYSKLLISVLEQARNTNFYDFENNRRAKIRLWYNILNQAGLEMDPSLLRIISN